MKSRVIKIRVIDDDIIDDDIDAALKMLSLRQLEALHKAIDTAYTAACGEALDNSAFFGIWVNAGGIENDD
jgi:hypothetical protein